MENSSDKNHQKESMTLPQSVREAIEREAEAHHDSIRERAVSFGHSAVASWMPSDSYSKGATLWAERCEKLIQRLEELRDAACTAVNWRAVIEECVGSAPWISQGDANDVDLAVLKANDAIEEYRASLEGKNG